MCFKSKKRFGFALVLLFSTAFLLNSAVFFPKKVFAVDVEISRGKPVTLVDSTGTAVVNSDISNQGRNLVDGNTSTYAQTVSTLFGAVIHLGGFADVSSIVVTNYWANYITSLTIKGSADGLNWVTLASGISMSASEIKTVTLTSAYNGRFIWICPTAYSSSSWFCIPEIQVNGQMTDTSLLSLNRPASLIQSDGSAVTESDIPFPASNAVDGNTGNYAQTYTTFFGIKIDLQEKAKIRKVAVTNYWANYITAYDIKGSVDGITWTTLASNIAIGDSETKTTVLSTEYTGRFIWIAPLSFSTSTWRTVAEVSVYGQRTPPIYGYDNNGSRNFEYDGKKYIAFGIDLDSFAARDGDLSYLTTQIDANVYINANAVAIPFCWKTIEPTMNNYTFTAIDSYINLAKSRGLKVILMWHGIDYASGNNSFVPDYIINESNTYTRNYGSGFSNNSILCPSNPYTLDRERSAYNNLLYHIRETDTDKTVIAVSSTSEIDYVGGLLYPEQFLPPELDIRCECGYCNALYQNEGNVPFMEKQFSKYAKELIEFGALVYDLPSYSAVCANSWFAGWRYAENPVVLKSIVNRNNHIVVPSIANPDTLAEYKADMDLFTAAQIPGNFIFTDGIDMGSHINGNVECAPWLNILNYGGLGAVYWDSGIQNPSTSIVNNTTLKTKLRKYFAPLKGISYQLARLKSGSNRFWWQYGQSTSTGTTSTFTFKQTNTAAKDYGIAFELSSTEAIFAGSLNSGSYKMEITRTGGFTGFKFEKGYYDMNTGAWIKNANVSPTISGNKATITVGTSDAGLYDKSVYRYYY